MERLTNKDEDIISEGSSLNPEHFELTEVEEDRITNIFSQKVKSTNFHELEETANKQ